MIKGRIGWIAGIVVFGIIAFFLSGTASAHQTIRPSGNATQRANATPAAAVIMDAILVEYKNADALGAHLAKYWDANRARLSSLSDTDIARELLTSQALPSIHDEEFRQALEGAIQRGDAYAIELTSNRAIIGETSYLSVPNLRKVAHPFISGSQMIVARNAKTGAPMLRIPYVAKFEDNNNLKIDMMLPLYELTRSASTARIGELRQVSNFVSIDMTSMFSMGFVRAPEPQRLSVAVLFVTPRLAEVSNPRNR